MRDVGAEKEKTLSVQDKQTIFWKVQNANSEREGAIMDHVWRGMNSNKPFDVIATLV